MEKTIVIEGMSCGHCKASVEEALGKLANVDFVEVNLDDKMALVKGQDLDDALLKETIEDLGFDLVEIK